MFSGKGTRLVYYFFLMAVVSLILQFTEFTSGFFLTRPVNDNIFLSPLSIISLVLLADVVILVLLRTINYHKPVSNLKSIILTGFLYLLVLVSAIVIIFFIKILYINSGIDFNIEALFNIGVFELFWFLVFINILILYFLFSLLLFKWINALNLPFKTRSILSVGLIILTTIFIFFFSDIEVFTILLSFLIYFFLMDYFSEQKKINSSWLFSWLIVISGFTTLIIYHVYSIHQDTYRNKQIQNLIFERNDSIEKKFDELRQGMTFETESGKYYVDTLHLDSIKLLNLLNSGFIKTEPNIYFNPIMGEYFKLNSNTIEKNLYNLIYLYNL
ncbi:MAG TPA: hypothetical protein ENK91_05960, partial [Bacteroidetes bacterium]|nr:hypothetical protein [Bacteroidota bacterium]